MGSWVWPCPASSRITSGFGPRSSPGGIGSTNHQGIDIGGGTGAAIISARPGTVTSAGWNGGYGNCVQVNHGNNITTLYAHMSAIRTTKGATVKAGQRLGDVGMTGNATGPHLHFETIVNGKKVNPVGSPVYINASWTVANYTGPGTSSSGSDSTGASSPGGSGSGSSGSVDTGAAGGTIQQAIDTKKSIDTVVIKSVTGQPGVYKYTALKEADSILESGVEIMIQNNNIQLPVIANEVRLTWERKGTAGKLEFDVVKDADLNIQEGNPVRMRVDGADIFYGYIFEKKRQLGGSTITVTAKDQLRYLEFTSTFVYKDMTYTELLRSKAEELKLTVGDLEDTVYKIEKRIEEGSVLDALYYAADITLLNNNNIYVLYDEFGKLRLSNISNMKTDVYIDSSSISSAEYKSTIDKDVYNKIVLAYDNGDTGEREVYVTQSPETQELWGVLQYYENVPSGETSVLSERGKVMLEHYNRKKRTLKLNGVFGSFKVRGGSSITLYLNVGDEVISNYMVVDKVVHRVKAGVHLMDLTVVGPDGEYV